MSVTEPPDTSWIERLNSPVSDSDFRDLASLLLDAVDSGAAVSFLAPLTLDAKRGVTAEHLYRRMGWTHAGTIPLYALDPDGTPHDAVIFYKIL